MFKQTTLAFNECPDDLARWLVASGADLSMGDSYGETPLHARAGHWQGRIDILLELGADVHAGENIRGTPLHKAAGVGNVRSARLLLDHGARVAALNSEGQSPLVYALQRCQNTGIKGLAPMAELLLDAAASQTTKSKSLAHRILSWSETGNKPVTPAMKACVQRIGTNFEFHRDGYNRDDVGATSAALEKLYVLFGVTPVPRRSMHEGKSLIMVNATRWDERYEQLWQKLVPSSGAANTVQGEVVRISGRIRDEFERNGGANWDADYRKMADAFLVHISSCVTLPEPKLSETRKIISEVKARRGDTERICALAVEWVALNPKPETLSPPDYSR